MSELLLYTNRRINEAFFLLDFKPFALAEEFVQCVVLLIVEHRQNSVDPGKGVGQLTRLGDLSERNVRNFLSKLVLLLLEELLEHVNSDLGVE